MQAPTCLKCDTRHWSGQDCPADKRKSVSKPSNETVNKLTAPDEVEKLKQRVAELEQLLEVLRTDSAAVWVSILQGKIARPQALEHYEECKARVEVLEAENAKLRSKLEPKPSRAEYMREYMRRRRAKEKTGG